MRECVLELVDAGMVMEQAERMAALIADPASTCHELDRVAEQLTQVLSHRRTEQFETMRGWAGQDMARVRRGERKGRERA